VSATRAAQAVDPDAARSQAQHILGGRRFNNDQAPRPLRGPLEWMGDRLRPVGEWIGDVLGHVSGWVWLLLGAAVVAVIVWRIIVVVSRRGGTIPASIGRGRRLEPEDSEDPDELERAADAAERTGDFERALRLRFRAGLLRLGDRGAIAYRPSVTTGEVRRALGSNTFDELAHTFEDVAYGGKPAQAPDVDAAKREWPHVLEEAPPR